jgi:predicted short-subunit dehydrogenase-like oxidoreductase (DUF2520 family)
VSQDSRLGVGVIGAGRVGPILARALAGAGHQLVGITPSSTPDSERVASILPGVEVLDALEVARRSQLVVIALPDDALGDLVNGLAIAKAWQPGQLVVHTSIRHGLGVLDPATQQGVIPLALHPLLEFTGTSMDLQRMNGSFAAITAPPVAIPIAEALALEMGLEPLVVSEDQRGEIASAAALATSFAQTTIREAAVRLSAAGIDNPGVVLGPLVGSSVDNALREIAGNEVERGAR